VMTVSVCLCVCLSVHECVSGITRPIFTKFVCLLPNVCPWLGSPLTFGKRAVLAVTRIRIGLHNGQA